MALFTKNDQEIEAQSSMSLIHTPPAFPTMVITSNLWILISIPTMQGSATETICPDKGLGSSLLHILRLPSACSATLRYFHLPPHYEDHTKTVHLSLDKANLNTINISALDFHIQQHFSSYWTAIPLWKLVDILEIPVEQFCKHMIDQDGSTLPFEINRDMKQESYFTWKHLAHPGTYIWTISMVFIACKYFKIFGADLHPEALSLLPSLIIPYHYG